MDYKKKYLKYKQKYLMAKKSTFGSDKNKNYKMKKIKGGMEFLCCRSKDIKAECDIEEQKKFTLKTNLKKQYTASVT